MGWTGNVQNDQVTSDLSVNKDLKQNNILIGVIIKMVAPFLFVR